MFNKTLIQEPSGDPQGLVIALAGRSISVGSMYGFIHEMGLYKSVVVTMEPVDREWYPQPNGPEDQKAALAGIARVTPALRKRIRDLREFFRIDQSHIALIGYSAGGVMALKMAEVASREYAAVVSVAGAILDPKSLALSRTNTPILLRHNADDEVFSWEERFIPTRDALVRQGYNVTVEENEAGNHGVCLEDAHLIGRFVATHLGYFSE